MTEKRIWLAGLFCLATLISCAHSERFGPPGLQATETLITRGNRNIPVVLYDAKDSGRRKIALLAAGYGLGPTDYTFLSDELVKRGFVVAALPSHLKGDHPIPSGPDTATLRRSFWDNGVAHIARRSRPASPLRGSSGPISSHSASNKSPPPVTAPLRAVLNQKLE